MGLYIKEIVRLKQIIDNLRELTQKQLIFMAVGASMEEIVGDPNYMRYNQWRQLFPSYVEDLILKGIKTTVIVVSPNKTFDPDMYRDPVFISKTDRTFRWRSCEKGTYRSIRYDVTVHVICSKFPSENKKRSEQIHMRLCDMVERDDVYIDTNNILQTEEDLKFINNFYDSLDKLIKEIDGMFICNSYATFNIRSFYGYRYNNYRMFRELKQVFQKNSDKDNILLSEWVHDTKNTKVSEIDYTKDLSEELNIGASHLF